MNRSEISEIRKNLKIDKTSIVRVAGCYVNAGKEKVCTFSQRFGTLDENERFKYLEILNRSLSGKIRNHLQTLPYETEEELSGERFRLVNGLRDSEIANESLLDVFYDRIIDSYENPGNYLILLFYDVIDIMKRTADGIDLDESSESFRYIAGAVCPVELSDPGLSYLPEAQTIGARVRDWTVKNPETGFLYPVLTDRSCDIHNLLFFSKDPKAPHKEMAEDVLGCTWVLSEAQQRTIVKGIISKELEGENKDFIKEVVSDFEYALSEKAEENEQIYGEDTRLSLDSDILKKAMENTDISVRESHEVAEKITAAFSGCELYADALVEPAMKKKGQDRAERKELLQKIDHLTAISSVSEDYRILKFSADIEPEIREIDGVRCYIIPETEAELS